MDTPIYDFLCNLIKKDTSRFFMPGHKGNINTNNDFEMINKYDITEINGADALYSADSIIKNSEDNASRLFGSKATLYSAGGSTLCIQTMCQLIRKKGRKIIASRNAHMSFVNSCILLDLEPVWILPEQSDEYGVCGNVTPNQVKDCIKENLDAVAVYITTPDYLGNVCDIKAISKICDEYKIDLLVDNAHGAYLKFLDKSYHPIDLGATMCCDSAHKTLPVLTSGAYLHLSNKCAYEKSQVKNIMNMFGSTSPSYLVLCSLDLCNDYLQNKARKDYELLKSRICAIKEKMQEKGIFYLENKIDFCKITIDANKTGYTKEKLCELLSECNIEYEYANSEYIVLLLSPFLRDIDFKRLDDFINIVTPKTSIKKQGLSYKIPKKIMSPKKAFDSQSEIIHIDESENRVCASTISLCPPGVCAIVCGEQIDKQTKKILKNSGNINIKVVK